MTQDNALPLVVEPAAVHQHLGDARVRIIDLCDATTYEAGHLPGAVHLEYAQLLRKAPPAMGLLPEASTLSDLLGRLGITPDTHVIAYDDAGGGKASRLLWTLHTVGHRRYSLLNGGLAAWTASGYAVDPNPVEPPETTHYPVNLDPQPESLADKAWVLQHLDDPGVAILDARSPEEFRGEDVRANRGGHIPGASNLEWTQVLDPDRHRRLRSDAELRALLETRGITPDKEVVTHCQTHHRSSLLWLVMRHLGYPSVRGYAGSWSEWGNDPNVPIEQ